MVDTMRGDMPEVDCSDCGKEEVGKVFIKHWGPLVPPGTTGYFGPKCWEARQADGRAGHKPRPLGVRFVKAGIVVAVCTSPKEGVPKCLQPSATIAEFGFAGDFHCKPMRRSFSRLGTKKPNTDRHITIVAKEALDYANNELTLPRRLKPGDLAENITTSDLGDLSDVLPGARVKINDQLVFEVVEQNEPCGNLRVYHPRLGKVIRGKRGLLCRVVGGIGTVVTAEDRIQIEW